MGYRAKLKDILNKKPVGEVWHCYQVPEEYHCWTLANKWKSMEKYGVTPTRIKVAGSNKGSRSVSNKYTEKNPIRIVGVDVIGQETAVQNVKFIWNFRVDGIREINDVLTELADSEGRSVSAFSVKELEVYNKNSGIVLFCETHNPDGKAVALYSIVFQVNGIKKFYPNIMPGDLQRYVGDFRGQFTHCVNTLGLQTACAIKNKIKSKQIKRRLKAT